MRSKNSVPVGMPKSAISLRSFLETLNPSLILKELSILGSLINPFHPIVVLGFSKFTLITTISSFSTDAENSFKS